MIVLTGCLAVLFSEELNIGELPEWFQSAFKKVKSNCW